MIPLGKPSAKKPTKETVEETVEKMEKGRKLASNKGSIGAKTHCLPNKKPHIETLPEVKFKDPVLIHGPRSGALPLEIRNTGGATMTISSVTIPANPTGQFSVKLDSMSVDSLGSTVAQVKFTARKDGRQLGKMLIVSDAENNGSGKEVVLIGVGLRMNRITPVLKLAAKLVWYSSKPAQIDPEKIELTYRQAHTQSTYTKGGTLSWDSTIVAVFRDRACKKPEGGGSLELTNAELKGTLELWVRGLKEAKSAEFSLELEDPNDPRFIIEPQAREQIEVKELNVVTPKLEAEYLVALLRRESDPWKEFPADPAYVEIWFEESKKSPHYPDAKNLVLKSGGHLWLAKSNTFADAVAGDLKVTAKDVGGAGKRFKVWVWGKTAGAFKLKLELEDSGLAEVKTNPPAELDFGVVELELVVHQHDATALEAISIDQDTGPIEDYHTNLKDEDLPGQKAMTDDEKTAEATARLLHVQKSGNFGRARVLCKKLDATQWPAGTGDYQIVIRATSVSGSVEVFDAEWDGVKQATPKVKVSELKAADKEFWVEGATATTKRGGARLDLGLDRAPGGLAKTAKYNGDWARFTVVEIKEVKFEAVTDADRPKIWDGAQRRYYINLDANARKLKDDATGGRKIAVTATLTQKIEDVTVHFMLAGHNNNWDKTKLLKGIDDTFDYGELEPALKTTDKTNRDDLLHVSGTTDDQGVAKTDELVLSAIGGEIYKIGAYLDQDPHLAKYVLGHAGLEKRKPVLSGDIYLWRKIWYQITRSNTTAAPTPPQPTITAFRNVKVALLASATQEIYDPATLADDLKKKTVYPRSVFHPANPAPAGTLVVIGDQNWDSFKDKLDTTSDAVKGENPKVHVVVCDEQWDGSDDTGVLDGIITSEDVDVPLPAERGIVKPPLQGGDLGIVAQWKDGTTWKDIGEANIEVEGTRPGMDRIKLNLPAKAKALLPGPGVKVKLELKLAAGAYCGESDGRQILAIYDSDGNYCNTVTHEIGHSVAQVYDGAVTGVPEHESQYEKDGSHCAYPRATADPGPVPAGKKYCVMYHEGPNPSADEPNPGSEDSGVFCERCHPYLLLADMENLG